MKYPELPGYFSFRLAASLFADLFPGAAKVIDGDDPRMVRICQALQRAFEYGVWETSPDIDLPAPDPEAAHD